jgi:hypothetical protein
MLSYPRFHAAEVIPAAFGAVPAGPATGAALRNCDTTGMTSSDMTKFFGQARPPRKIPL